MNENDKLLKNFLDEHFDFYTLRKVGFFKGLKKRDIHQQAERICQRFGFKTVYEYGAIELRAHVTYAENERPLYVDQNGKLIPEPFVTEIKNIYNE